MITVSSLPPGIGIAELAGPVLVGYLLHWGLFGTLSIQLYLYYQAFPNDRLFNKCLVYTICAIEFVQTMLMTDAAFSSFAYGFGDVSALDDVRFEWLTVPVMSGIVAFIGQSFYAHRLYKLSKSRWLPLLIVVFSLTSTVGAFCAGSFSFKVGADLALVQSKSNYGIGIWLGGAALVDIVIALLLTYYVKLLCDSSSKAERTYGFQLLKHDTGFRGTHALVARTIRLTIETGSVTALVAITDVTLFFSFPGKPYFIAAGSILPKLYANTIFAVLNARFQIEGGRGSTCDKDFVSFPSFIRNPDGNRRRASVPLHGDGPIVSVTREVFADRELEDMVKLRDLSVGKSTRIASPMITEVEQACRSA
ncbi:hypothetical protein C8R47DRAFT_67878 [Mycena vitilis]|nr:hypothetical protein C8R47DRAFT_67878 [Mycena vitilis]